MPSYHKFVLLLLLRHHASVRICAIPPPAHPHPGPPAEDSLCGLS